jgi:hypothetical protein
MDHAIIARALHIPGVVLWIGGAGFVTTVLLPAVRRMKSPEKRVAFFEAVELRFAWQARTLPAGGCTPWCWGAAQSRRLLVRPWRALQ